ncbi:MAG: hypothetical protein NC131_04850 [Roseburia sp.]|nr:hypothetical protein [Roseburia sp.]
MSKLIVSKHRFDVGEEIVATNNVGRIKKGDHLIVLSKDKPHKGKIANINVKIIISKEEDWIKIKYVRKLHNNEKHEG